MSLILITSGVSKIFSAGGFKAYYWDQFANPELRIKAPPSFIEVYLSLIPYIEMGLGVLLLLPFLKRITIPAWYVFMASLLVGHYILQEWSAVNEMLPYFFLGMFVHVLPTSGDLKNSPQPG